MAKAKKLPSGNWRIRICIGKDGNGKFRYKSFTHKDRKTCERLAAEYADAHRVFVEEESLACAMESYITQRTPVLSPSTIRGYRNMQKMILGSHEAFCALSIYDLDANAMQKLVNEWSASLSPKTIRNRIGFINSVLLSKGAHAPELVLPNKVKPKLYIPDINDVNRILEEARGTEMEIPIMLAAFGPLRRSEIAALEMSDIEGNTIHVSRAVVTDESGKNVIKGTKTYDSDRYIVMPEEVVLKIRERAYITKIKDPQHISQRFAHIAKKAGCPNTRFHDLRHFCASYLHSKGVPEQYILERGGWTSNGVMKEVYRHTLASGSDNVNKSVLSNFQRDFFVS